MNDKFDNTYKYMKQKREDTQKHTSEQISVATISTEIQCVYELHYNNTEYTHKLPIWLTKKNLTFYQTCELVNLGCS